VAIIDTGTLAIAGHITTATPIAIAVVPDQVTAAVSATTAGLAAGFDASGSTATAGIASYAWNFGDGATTTTTAASAIHLYANSGTYPVSVTPTDANGCGATTFTGQTAYCNHSGPAQTSVTATLASGPPGPPGPPGPAGLAVVLSAPRYKASAGRRFSVRFATSSPGTATLTVLNKSQDPVDTVTEAVGAGLGSIPLRLKRRGRYGLQLSVAAGGQTAIAGATVTVSGGRGKRQRR
jgi:hypothetical protein